MTGTINPTLPTIGDPNSTEDVDTRNALITLRDAINAGLTSSNAPLTLGIWQTHFSLSASGVALGTGHYGIDTNGLIASGSGSFTAFPWDAPSVDTLSGYTHKWRIVCGWQTNATAIGTAVFTANLYPVTSVGGGAGLLTTTLTTGSPVNTKALNSGTTPGTSTSNSGEASSSVTAPAAGLYVPGLQIATAGMAANSAIRIHFQLQHMYT